MTRTFRSVRLIRDVLRGAAAAIATGVLVAGVPAGLWRLVGWPLPDTIPAWDRLVSALGDSYIPDDILVNALAVVCWLAWAQIAVALVVEAAAVIAGRPTPRLPLARPAQVLAARLITAIALLGTLTATRTTAADPTLSSAMVVQTAPIALAHDTGGLDEPAAPDVRTGEPDGTVQASSPTYTVQRRDDLWSIAERHLGDPYRWPEIWRRNRHRTMADGRAFTDPDCIHPGWVLDLPRDATDLPTRADEQAPTGSPSDQRDAEVGAPAPRPPDAPAPYTPYPSDNGAGTERTRRLHQPNGRRDRTLPPRPSRRQHPRRHSRPATQRHPPHRQPPQSRRLEASTAMPATTQPTSTPCCGCRRDRSSARPWPPASPPRSPSLASTAAAATSPRHRRPASNTTTHTPTPRSAASTATTTRPTATTTDNRSPTDPHRRRASPPPH